MQEKDVRLNKNVNLEKIVDVQRGWGGWRKKGIDPEFGG
jgi:hypothetical protein